MTAKHSLMTALNRLDSMIQDDWREESEGNMSRSVSSKRSAYSQVNNRGQLNAAQIAKDMKKLVEEADYSIRSTSQRSISQRMVETDTENESSMIDGTPVNSLLLQQRRIGRKRQCSFVKEAVHRPATIEFDDLFNKITKNSTNPSKSKIVANPTRQSKSPRDNRLGRQSPIGRRNAIPIHLRYSKEVQERENRICTLKQSLEKERHEKLLRENSQLYSRSNSKMKQTNVDDIVNALQRSTKKFLQKKNSNIKQIQSDLAYREQQKLTFMPQINRKSSKMAEKSGVKSN